MENIKKYISTKKILKEIINLNISMFNKIKFAREGIIVIHNSVDMKKIKLPEGWRFYKNESKLKKFDKENKRIEKIIEIYTV